MSLRTRGSDMQLRSGFLKSNSTLSFVDCQVHPSPSYVLAEEKEEEQRELGRFFRSARADNPDLVCCISSEDEVWLPFTSREREKKVSRRQPLRALVTRGPPTPGILTGLTDGESSDSPEEGWRSRPVLVVRPEDTIVFPYST
jgi:hypothetical protein